VYERETERETLYWMEKSSRIENPINLLSSDKKENFVVTLESL
jgi:hypothetical protein